MVVAKLFGSGEANRRSGDGSLEQVFHKSAGDVSRGCEYERMFSSLSIRPPKAA